MWIAMNKDNKWHAFTAEPTLIGVVWSSFFKSVPIEHIRHLDYKESLSQRGDGMWKATDRCGEVYVFGSKPLPDLSSGQWESVGNDLFQVVVGNLNRWDSSLEQM